MSDPKPIASQADRTRRPPRFLGQYIIKQRFQMKFSLIVFAFLSVAVFAIWLEGHLALESMQRSGMINDLETIAQLKSVNTVIGNTSILMVAIVFGLSLFFSHFVAGPIYRFEKTLEEMKLGNLSMQVKLRKHDELKDMADLFNQALASLRNKVRKERETLDNSLTKAAKISETLRQKGHTAEADELDKLLHLIKNTPPQITI
jgi:methyl-accepting chemotaxis protein